MRIATCIAAIAFASAPLASSADAGAGPPRPLAEVLREAASSKKPVLLDFSTVW